MNVGDRVKIKDDSEVNSMWMPFRHMLVGVITEIAYGMAYVALDEWPWGEDDDNWVGLDLDALEPA